MDEFMTDRLHPDQTRPLTEAKLCHSDPGEFPDLLDSCNSLATLSSDYGYASYAPSDDAKLDSILKTAEGMKIEPGLTLTNLNEVKPNYPDIDLSKFEGLGTLPAEPVVVAKRSVVQVSEVKTELEFEVKAEPTVIKSENAQLNVKNEPRPTQPAPPSVSSVEKKCVLTPPPGAASYAQPTIPMMQPRQQFAPSPSLPVLPVSTQHMSVQSPITSVNTSSTVVHSSLTKPATTTLPIQFKPKSTKPALTPPSVAKDLNNVGMKKEASPPEISIVKATPPLFTVPANDDKEAPKSSTPDPLKDTYTLTTSSGQKIEVPTIINGGYDFENLLCLFCEKQQFKNDKTLINHLLSHFGVAPKMATCPICGLSLQKKSFARHVRLHGDVQPEVCPYCKKEFREKRSLDKHVRAIHEAERPFPCDQCPETFRNTAELKAHVARHSKDHPFKCDVCSLSFQKQEALTTHYRLHTGERPYACNICDKTFNSEKNRRIHVQRHEGSLPHKCDVCDMTFQSKSHLLKHAVSHNRKTQVTVAKINTFLESFGASLGEFGLDEDYGSNDQISLHPATESGEIEDQSVKLTPCFSETETVEAAPADAAMSYETTDNENEVEFLEDSTSSSMFPSPALPALVKGLTEEDAERMARKELSSEIPPTPDGTHLCLMCNTRLGNKRAYVIHLRRHAGMLNYKCNYCPKTFQGQAKLNRHMNSHFKESLTPPNQPTSSTSLSAPLGLPDTSQLPPVRPVTSTIVSSDSRPLFGCNQCGATYSDKAALQEHTKMHLIEDAKAKFSTASKEKKVGLSLIFYI